MKIFVGTSGWFYSWNPERKLSWYLNNSKLNAIELNASFYRFPFPNQVKAWAKSEIAWAVKVNRRITHLRRLNKEARDVWEAFRKLFEPLDSKVHFYLFQMPPSFTPAEEAKRRVEKFAKKSGLGKRMAVEFRHPEWFKQEWVEWARKLGITFVSVDAPESAGLPREIFNTSGAVYLRIHGRSGWYSHYYTDEELREIAGKIWAAKPKPREAYIFFNNNHAMLENARRMREVLTHL